MKLQISNSAQAGALKPVGTLLALLLAALPLPAQQYQSSWSIQVERGRTEEAALRFSNACGTVQEFVVNWSGPGFVALLPGSRGGRLEPGEEAESRIWIDASTVRGGRFWGALSVDCPGCPDDPACWQRRRVLPVEIRVSDPRAPWKFAPVEAGSKCPVSRLKGPALADLYVEKIDQEACRAASPLSPELIGPEDDGYPSLARRSATFRLESGDKWESLEQLDTRAGFSRSERFLLALLESDRGPGAAKVPVEPAFYVSALFRSLRDASLRTPGWTPASAWLGEALDFLESLVSGGVSQPRHLSDADRNLLSGHAEELARRLDLRLPQPSRGAFITGVERVSLDGPLQASAQTNGSAPALQPPLRSFADFQREALYGPFGYYTTGHAQIGETGHFRTIPQKIFPVFGGLIGELAHRLFLTLLQENRLGGEAPFVIREDGGGRGELARSCLLFLQTMALIEPGSSYGELWRRLQFQEVEISPERVAEQRREVEGLEADAVLEAGKFEIVEADAIHHSSGAFTGLRLSNELLDVLPVEKFYVQASGKVEVVFPIPYLKRGSPALERLKAAWRPRWSEREQDAAALARAYLLPAAGSRIYLSPSVFDEYQDWLRSEEARLMTESPADGGRVWLPADYFPSFVEGLVDVRLLPDWEGLVQARYTELLAGMVYRGEAESEAYLELATAEYLSSIADSLAAGAVLIVDYMATSPIPNNTMLLAYGEQQEEYRQLNPYVPFGMKDVTLPPDSRLLRREAQLRGWREEHFGPQEDLRQLAGITTNPRIAAGLVAAHARLLILPRMEPSKRAAFDRWLSALARGSEGPRLAAEIARQLPPEFGIELDSEDRAALARTLEYATADTLWEPENPNFYLYLGTRGLLRGLSLGK